MKQGKRSKRATNDLANWLAYVQWVQQQAETQENREQIRQGAQ